MARQRIVPCLWFSDDAEEAAKFYTTVFKGAGKKKSKVAAVTRYTASAAKASGQPEGSVMTVTFYLDGQEYMALNGGAEIHLTEAVSFMVHCKSQKELDYFWDSLSAGGDEKAQMCGWLKDRFGLSWQIVPEGIDKLHKDSERSERVMRVLLQMKKLDIKSLKQAYKGKR